MVSALFPASYEQPCQSQLCPFCSSIQQDNGSFRTDAGEELAKASPSPTKERSQGKGSKKAAAAAVTIAGADSTASSDRLQKTQAHECDNDVSPSLMHEAVSEQQQEQRQQQQQQQQQQSALSNNHMGQQAKLKHRGSHKCSVTLSLGLEAEVFNASKGGWEPALDEWQVQVRTKLYFNLAFSSYRSSLALLLNNHQGRITPDVRDEL
jgi:hypothetical protein